MRYSERSEESKIHDRKTGYLVLSLYRDQEGKQRKNTLYQLYVGTDKRMNNADHTDFPSVLSVLSVLSVVKPPLPFAGESLPRTPIRGLG